MKKYTHAWIAFKAVERLEKAQLAEADKKYASILIRWFKSRKDGVINGAWYPDAIIKDNAKSHVLKFTPAAVGENQFRVLPGSMRVYKAGKTSALYKKPYSVASDNNLPERCEALAHSVIDNLRVQQTESKGSPIAPTDNHLALLLFMLSHYVADAHMPLHCDSRMFSAGVDLHGAIEGEWEDEIKKHFDIDTQNERFFYNRDSYPLNNNKPGYANSILKQVEDELAGRPFLIDWGQGNDNVLEYMRAVCQYSYLLSYSFLPPQYNETNITIDNWQTLAGQAPPFAELSVMALSDAIDSISRIWLRVWRRFVQWKEAK